MDFYQMKFRWRSQIKNQSFFCARLLKHSHIYLSTTVVLLSSNMQPCNLFIPHNSWLHSCFWKDLFKLTYIIFLSFFAVRLTSWILHLSSSRICNGFHHDNMAFWGYFSSTTFLFSLKLFFLYNFYNSLWQNFYVPPNISQCFSISSLLNFLSLSSTHSKNQLSNAFPVPIAIWRKEIKVGSLCILFIFLVLAYIINCII